MGRRKGSTNKINVSGILGLWASVYICALDDSVDKSLSEWEREEAKRWLNSDNDDRYFMPGKDVSELIFKEYGDEFCKYYKALGKYVAL